MKIHPISSVFAISAIAITATVLGNSPAFAGNTKFICSVNNGIPVTVAQTPRGNVSVIKWSSDYFSGSGWTPQKRCQEVSNKFQTYYSNGALNYLTTGIVNGLPVVCVASHEGGGCAGQLFTLKSGSNPSETLRRLLAVRVRAAGPLNESTSRVYIDMKQFLKTAPVEGGVSSNSSIQPQPTSPNQSQTASKSEQGLW